MNWSEIVHKYLPALVGPLETKLVAALQRQAKILEAQAVQKAYGQILKKSLDAAINAAEANLNEQDAAALVQGIIVEERAAATQIGSAIEQYAPLQAAVAVAEKLHGHDSDEANAARAARRAFVGSVPTAVGAVLQAVMKG